MAVDLAEFLAQFALQDADRAAARKQAMMMAGLGLLGARKGREGEAFARSGLLGMDAYNQSLEGARQSKVDKYKLASEWNKQQEAERVRKEKQAAFQNAFVPTGYGGDGMGPPTGQRFDPSRFAQGLGNVDPMTAASLLMPKEQDSPYAKIDPKDYTPESIAAYQNTRDPAVLRRYTPQEKPEKPPSLVGNVNPANFTPASVDNFLRSGKYSDLVRIDTTPRTTVNIDNAPKLPPGFRWVDGMVGQKVEPIPGGPQDSSKEDAQRVERKATSGDIVLSNIADAKQLAGKYTVGLAGVPLSKIPGTPAKDLKRKVDTIVANIGFDRLQQMREESKTGGALGQVAIQELEMLQAVLGSLAQDQSTGQFVKNLGDVEKQYVRAMQAYEAMKNKGGALDDPMKIRRPRK
jgi:hypothetical protein